MSLNLVQAWGLARKRLEAAGLSGPVIDARAADGLTENFLSLLEAGGRPVLHMKRPHGDLPFLCSAVGSYGAPGFTFAPSYNLGGWSYSLNGTVQLYGPDGSINDGNWHHLVHAFDRTGNARTYLDGMLADTRYANASGDLDTGNTINVGQDPTGTYAESGSMTLDDLAVWRREGGRWRMLAWQSTAIPA